jgi:hypothetical protein
MTAWNRLGRETALHVDLEKDADKYGWIDIIPPGQRGATWHDRVGTGSIMVQLAAVKRRYNVDENRVFSGGFSGGGHTTGLYHPTPLAGIVALSGNIVDFSPRQRAAPPHEPDPDVGAKTTRNSSDWSVNHYSHIYYVLYFTDVMVYARRPSGQRMPLTLLLCNTKLG